MYDKWRWFLHWKINEEWVVDVHGFGGISHTMRGMRLVDAITAVEIDDKVILLRIHGVFIPLIEVSYPLIK